MSSSSPVTPAPSETSAPQSVMEKLWAWIKGKVVIVEADLSKLIGSKAAQDLETIGKNLLDSEIGALATAAMVDATDVASGVLDVSKAITGLVSSAASNGKSITRAAALQTIALLQNTVPTSSDPTVTPS